jgi:hypothetical protein
MSAERRDAEPLQPPVVAEIPDGTQATALATARRNVQRAADQAVMAIFELAFSLESLGDAIGSFHAETRRPSERANSLMPSESPR